MPVDRALLALLAGSLLPVPHAAAQTGVATSAASDTLDVLVPATPAGLAATAWLRALNSGDSLLVRRFIDDWMVIGTATAELQTTKLLAQHRRWGTVRVAAIISHDADRIAIQLRPTTGEPMTAAFTLEPPPGKRIATIWYLGRAM